MADLYEFPYLESAQEEEVKVKLAFEKKLGCALNYVQPLPSQKHTFTRFRVQLFPHLFESEDLTQGFLWKKKEELKKMPFSSGHRRILNAMLNK